MKKIILILSLIVLIGCEPKYEIDLSEKEYYVWYSAKQLEYIETMVHFPGHNVAILEDGTRVAYSSLTSTPDTPEYWDDFKYLGRGKWFRRCLSENEHKNSEFEFNGSKLFLKP